MINRLILLTISALCSVMSLNATLRHVEAQRKVDLVMASSAEDSLTILYDIFDIVPRAEKGEYAKELYRLATRLKRDDVKLDILRQLANIYLSSDSVGNVVLREARLLSKSDEQLETCTFIRIQREMQRARVASESERQRRMTELMGKLSSRKYDETLSNEDLNEAVVELFNLCVYLGFTTHEELLSESLERLEKLIDRLPFKLYAIRNSYYTQAALSYTDMGETEKAVGADRQLLKTIDALEKRYHRQNRRYRDYSVSRYVCLRRMLYNAEALDSAEVDVIYRNIKQIAAMNSDVSDDMAHNQRAEIFYYVAKKDWQRALSVLKKQIDNPANKSYRQRMLKELFAAAVGTGDVATEITVGREYIAQLEEYINLRAADHYAELGLLAELSSLKERNASLEYEQLTVEHGQRRSMLILVSVLLAIMIALSVALLMIYRRTRRLSQTLAKSNLELKEERDNVLETQRELIAARDRALAGERQKVQFINNMSHEIRTPLMAIADYSRLIADCVTDEKRAYLSKYVQLVDLNNELVQRMVNDVLDIAEIDNGRLTINLKPTGVNEICQMALNTVAATAPPEIDMRMIDPRRPDVTVNTDRERVEQVLINLLRNGVKFTRHGSVELDYEVVDNRLVFSVTDTGIGIPPEKDEAIFVRFEKLNKSIQGVGLGLPVSRLIARLLGGNVEVDRSRKRDCGTRMIFYIPMN